MIKSKVIKGITEEEKWQQVAADLKSLAVPFQYSAVIEHNGKQIAIAIDMDPGGGFEGGYEFTSMTAPVLIQFTSITAVVGKQENFRFALHDEGVIDRVGKFLHVEEDVNIGYPEFDKQLVVKTNDVERVKQIFKDTRVRKVFQSLSDFSLQISQDDNKKTKHNLELMIDRAVTDARELKKIYNAFTAVLDALEIESAGGK
jgi:hypothetical protein